MSEQLELGAGSGELDAGLALDRVTVLGSERIPESAVLVVGPHVADLDGDQLRPGNADADLPARVIDGDVWVVAKIDTRQQAAGDDDQRSLGRPVPGVLVDDDVAHHRLAGHELGDGLYLIDDDIVSDRRLAPTKERSGNEPRRAVAEGDDDNERDEDEGGADAE